MNFYRTDKQRTVSVANYTHYIQGFVHPDRILDEHDFVYIMNGVWDICQNDNTWHVEQDDVIILHGGQHHFGHQDCSPGTHTMYFHISTVPGDSFSCPNNQAAEGVTLETVIHCRSHPRVRLLFQELIAIWFEASPCASCKLNHLFSLLLWELADCSAGSCPTSDPLVLQAMSTLAMNPQKFYRLAELADILHLSEKSLNKRFQAAFQKTVYQYQVEEKIRIVCQFLLDYPDAKLRTVAENFGFYDEYHMSKLFKKYAGISPGLYRRQNAAKQHHILKM